MKGRTKNAKTLQEKKAPLRREMLERTSKSFGNTSVGH